MCILLRKASCELLILFFSFISLSVLFGKDVSLVNEIEAEKLITYDLRISQADRLLGAGMAQSANSILGELLEGESHLSPAIEDKILLGLVKGNISKGKFTEASRYLEKISEINKGSGYQLQTAVLAFGNGLNPNWSIIETSIGLVNLSDLDKESRFWFHLLKALIAEKEGNGDLLNEFIATSRNQTQDLTLLSTLQNISLRWSLQFGVPKNEVLEDLRNTFINAKGSAVFAAAKQYAIALWAKSNIDEALTVLDLEKQFKRFRSNISLVQREELRLLRVMISGTESTEAQLALAELIRSGSSLEVMEIALQLLSQQSEVSSVFTDLLNEIIARDDAHALVGQMYYYRSQLALTRGELVVAKSDAEKMLENYPGLDRINDALFILAFAALENDPPQFRTAADFLIQLRNKTESSDSISELNERIGDCYYLNKDFKNASQYYNLALSLKPEVLGQIFLKITSASILGGELDEALNYLDQISLNQVSYSRERWQAEWNISQGLIRNFRANEALNRVRVLNQGVSEEVPLELALRLVWLELKLSLELDPESDVVEMITRVDQSLRRLESNLSANDYESTSSALLTGEFLLLKGIFEYRNDRIDAAKGAFEALRKKYASSIAAERSYLIEAAELESRGAYTEAQKVMLYLVDTFPESQLAAQCIFEAAILNERQGTGNYVESIRLLDRLASNYPNSPLVYRARLKQGDLLRLLNDFTGAQLIFETLVNGEPEHPLRHIAELSLAECMLALAKSDAKKLAKVASNLERLVDLPSLSLDFKLEVMYKWAFALLEADAPEQARVILAQSIAENLLDTKSASELGSAGRYWASRTLLELGEQMKIAGDLAEARIIFQKLIAYNLPGRGLAQTRIDSLETID